MSIRKPAASARPVQARRNNCEPVRSKCNTGDLTRVLDEAAAATHIGGGEPRANAARIRAREVAFAAKHHALELVATGLDLAPFVILRDGRGRPELRVYEDVLTTP